MTKIKIKTAISTLETSYRRGQVVSVEAAVAKQWIRSGIAESMQEATKKRASKQR